MKEVINQGSHSSRMHANNDQQNKSKCQLKKQINILGLCCKEYRKLPAL